MKYVILILALLVGLPSIATAQESVAWSEQELYCSADCGDYSTDVECRADGVCIEPYAACYQRCLSPADSMPASYSGSNTVACSLIAQATWRMEWDDWGGTRGLDPIRYWRLVWQYQCGFHIFLRFGTAYEVLRSPAHPLSVSR